MNAIRRKRGQVLLIAVMVTLILLICVMVVFNLFLIVRGRIKTETAEQSAALTAAEWQRESLNLIGEINLIKASRSLLELDAPPAPEPIPDGKTELDFTITPRVRALTEMQSRLAFVAPLIAFGAAQQAAKQNGVPASSGNWNINLDMDSYMERLETSGRYLDQPEIIHYYRWREPYKNMIRALANGFLAVRPNGRTPGLDRVNPSWLADEGLYQAIHAEWWCHATLNYLVKSTSFPEGAWWKDIDYSPNSFPRQSEIMPLNVTFSGDSSSVEDGTFQSYAASFGGARAYFGGSDPEIPYLRWCFYDSFWNDIDVEGGLWHGEGRLRADLKESFHYNGAVAYAETFVDTEHLRFRPVNDPNRPLQSMKSENAFTSRSVRLGSNYPQNFDNRNGSTAQAVGAFPSGESPTALPIVLPVFGQTARIPTYLKNFTVFQINFTALARFLIALSQIQDINDTEETEGMTGQYYLEALRLLSDADWRKRGYNPDFTGSLSDFPPAMLFGTTYRYPASADGPGWLQAAYIGNDDNPPREATNGTLYHDKERRRYYMGGQYVEYNAAGEFKTNESVRCQTRTGYTPSGSSPVGPPGVN